MNSSEVQVDHIDPRTRALAAARGFLARHHCLNLATDGPEGIWACTVFYVNREFDLYFLSGANTRHIRNVDANPRVAGTINDDVEDWLAIRAVHVEGAAERIDDSHRRELLELFALRYPYPESFWWSETGEVPRGEQRIYRIRPTRVLYFDHRLRDTRFEVPVELLRAPESTGGPPPSH